MPHLVQIKQYDAQDMLQLLSGFSEQCRHAREIAEKFQLSWRDKGTPNNILIAGMGGSAIGGDLVKAVLNGQSPIPIAVHRNYSLPFSFFNSISNGSHRT